MIKLISVGAGVLARAAIALAAAWLAQGCIGGDEGGKKSVKVKPQLMRADAPSGPAPLSKPAARGGTALNWSSDVIITSLKVPIKQISLHNAAFNHAADIYLCAGSSESCQVELAGSAFQDLLDAVPATVEMGDYAYVFVKTCEDDEGEYRSSVTGSVNLDGRAWHTNAAAVLSETGPAAPLSITIKGCGSTYALPRTLHIADSLGEQVSFKLYFDLRNLAYAALGNPLTAGAWTPGNCAGDRPSESGSDSPPFLCIGYPGVSGIIDSRPVSQERYRIDLGATMGLFFTADDLPVGGYTRPYYQEGVITALGYGAMMPIRDLRKNTNGTLFLAEFGAGARGESGSDFQVESFQRATHEGAYTGRHPVTGSPSSGTYQAERLAP